MFNIQETLDKMGIALGLRLGEGGFATVYEMYSALTGDKDKHHVVKITYDETDAFTADLARRAQDAGGCKNLVRVYDVVAALEPAYYDRQRKAYIIISEKLEMVPYEVASKMPDAAWSIYADTSDIMKSVALASKYGYKPDVWCNKLNVFEMAASNIKGMCEDLASIGITAWDDYKPRNTMYRPGYGIVVSDLGCTVSPKHDPKSIAFYAAA